MNYRFRICLYAIGRSPHFELLIPNLNGIFLRLWQYQFVSGKWWHSTGC